MTLWRLIHRSLVHYWRSHLGVMLGAGVGTAVLVGALVVGDSVRQSLREMALSRLGGARLALAPRNRFFRADLAGDLAGQLKAEVAPALVLDATAARADGLARANRVQVLGVDERFWKLAPRSAPPRGAREEEVLVNDALARRLPGPWQVRAGRRRGETSRVALADESPYPQVVLRVERPSLLPRDAPLSSGEGSSTALRRAVGGIVSQEDFGRFNLHAAQLAPCNVFMPLAELGKMVGLASKANVLLVGKAEGGELTAAQANAALRTLWRLGDAGLELRPLGDQGVLELRSRRVFLEPGVVEAASEIEPGAVGVLTYLVNELRKGSRSTPYSMVAAIGELRPASSQPALGAPAGGLVPPDMGDDEILINTWLAEDLGAGPGDRIDLTYFGIAPSRRLEERTRSFRVRGVLEMKGAAADRDLMGDFPGLAQVKNCRDWKTSVPIDLKKIRGKDEEYWNRFEGTPKAFVTLRSGRRMWGNRFGDLTAVRYPLSPGARDRVDEALRRRLDPASVGLFFQDVRREALAQSDEAMDFGRLFLGFSFFLIVAAMILTALLFVLEIQQRTGEMGVLLVTGFSPASVRRLLVLEGAVLAVAGAAIGAAGGALYTRALLYGLSTLWRQAVAGWPIRFHAQPLTLLFGAAVAAAVAIAAMWLVLWRQARKSPGQLLAGGGGVAQPPPSVGMGAGHVALWIAVGAAAGAVVLLGVMGLPGGKLVAAGFFGAGTLLLAAAIAFCWFLLSLLARRSARRRLSLSELGVRNAARRRGRSLAVVALLACGSFLVAAVGANRRDVLSHADRRSSGTGGFALYAESTFGVIADPGTAPGRKAWGLDDRDMEGVSIVPLRLREGDDASCLNLNRVRTPRLLGVRWEELQKRKAFEFGRVLGSPGEGSAWSLLHRKDSDDAVPAVADEATIVWAMGKKLGDVLTYPDERGEPFRIRLVGSLGNSILQGSLIIGEDQFVRRFASQEGYRVFLIDAPPGAAQGVEKTLSDAFQDVGLDAAPAAERLAAFSAVENTYLSIFQVLGGLGLLLGSGGLALAVLRNVMERRGELAILRAVGFSKASLQWLVLCEHWGLLFGGLLSGVFCALVAVLPAIRSSPSEVPWVSLPLTLLAVAASGVLWTWLATALALRGEPLAALRNE